MKALSIIFVLALVTGCAGLSPTSGGGSAGDAQYADPVNDIYFGG